MARPLSPLIGLDSVDVAGVTVNRFVPSGIEKLSNGNSKNSGWNGELLLLVVRKA